MDNKYENYDMFDKLIANNKKAQSWTIFWVTMLCILAAVVLWMASTISEKNKTISAKNDVITANNLSLEQKSRIIDSLTENCNKAKTEIIKDYNTALTTTQTALNIVTEKDNRGSTEKLSAVEKQKIKDANISIANINSSIKVVKENIESSPPRLFTQFNNADDNGRVNKFLSVLKAFSEYVIAPPELINTQFPTVIKFYNYQDAKPAEKTKEENMLKHLIATQFNIPEESIRVSYEKNARIKKTVEIWIDTKAADTRQQVIINKQK